MKRINGSSLLVLACALNQCTSEPGGQYQAPRRPGESVLSWADASSGECSPCPDGVMECDPFYLGTKEHWEGLPVRAEVLYEYVALLDFDYGPEPEDVVPGHPPYTRLKVRKVLEEFVNLVHGDAYDEIVVNGQCDENGHCMMFDGSYPMPLWSGTSLVLAEVWCPHVSFPKTVLYVREAYAVEKDTLYDFYGFGYDWNALREAIREAETKAMETRPEACTPKPPTPPPTQSGDTNPAAEEPLPLPDP